MIISVDGQVMEQYCILVLSVQDKLTGGLFVEASKVVSFTTTISHNFVTIYEQSYVSPVYLTSLLEYPLIGIKLRTVRMQGRYSQDEQDIMSGLLIVWK